MDEFEAIRLADHKGLGQQEAAQSMRISQQTFSRTLRKARRKTADGIVNGKMIRILPSNHTNHIQVEKDNKDTENTLKEAPNNTYLRSLGNLSRYPGK
jgi:DNA-binding transcriptional regulator LsrR (DeoR family)